MMKKYLVNYETVEKKSTAGRVIKRMSHEKTIKAETFKEAREKMRKSKGYDIYNIKIVEV